MVAGMKKLYAGMLLLLGMVGAGFATGAQAADIPPTNACVVKYDDVSLQMFKKYVPASPSRKDMLKFNRELNKAMVKAGCLSDAEPFLKNYEAKPFSEECKAGAKEAAENWKPLTRKIEPWFPYYRKKVRPVMNRYSRIIGKVIDGNASPALERRANRLSRIMYRRLNKFIHAVNPTIVAFRNQTSLIYLELISRRCFDKNANLADPNVAGPAAKVIRKNRHLVFATLIYQSMDMNSDATWAEIDASNS